MQLKNSKLNVTTDVKNVFDSLAFALNHSFLLTTLEKFGFRTNLIDWIKVFLNDQESCVINKDVTAQYLKLEKDAQQGDPVSA